MAIEDIGMGAGAGGFIGAILTFFGIKQRMDRHEKDIEKLSDHTVWRTTCQTTHRAVEQRLERIETKIDMIIANGK